MRVKSDAVLSTGNVTNRFYIGFASETNRNISERRVSQLDVHDQLTRTSPAVEFACSRNTFFKAVTTSDRS
jgi:hypothetical protein